MNTQDVANKYTEWMRQGKGQQVIQELYAENIISREMPNWPGQVVTEGIKAVVKKNEEWLASVEEFHSGEYSEPVVAGDHFTLKMAFDVSFKERGRTQMEELATFKVENGKITEEQFFYSM